MGFVLPEVIEGDGFVLRCWRGEDAAVLGELVTASREHLHPWMPWIAQEPLDLAARAELIAGWVTDRLAGGDAHYGIFTHVGAMGCCGLHQRIGYGGLEIGYWVDVRACRRGYATAAAHALTDAAFGFATIDRVEIHHDVANVASSGVPRTLGYTLVETRDDVIEAPGEAGPLCVWRVARDEWTQRR